MIVRTEIRSIGRRREHPGRLLERCYLIPLGLSQGDLAVALGISRRRLNEILRGHRAITPDTALRLAEVLGPSAEFWLERQLAYDLDQARRRLVSA